MFYFSVFSAIFLSITAPISAEAATTKVLGVNKTFTKTATKVSGLSSAEKKIVKVTVNKSKKKVTVKGIKPGKASFKIGSKSYTVKVGAVAIKKKSFATSLKVGTNKKVTVTSSYGAKDTLKWSSSKTSVVKVSKATTTASAKKVGTNTLKTVKAGTATITVKSKNTGKSLKVKVTVKAASTATATTVPTATGSATTTPSVAPTATATGSATTTPSVAPTATGGAIATPEATTAAAATATPETTTSAAIVSASAIKAVTTGASIIRVEFDAPVTATGDAVTFVVTKGTAKPTVSTVNWIDKTTALITIADTITADTYEVTATEKNGKELKTTFVGVKAVATTLSIDSVRVEANAAATIDISLKNNFGEKMSTKTGVVANVYNTTKSEAVNLAADPYDTDGKLKVNTAGLEVGDILRVTLTSGTLSATATVTVVKDKVAEKVSIGKLSLVNTKEDRVLAVAADSSNSFILPVSVKDQYDDATVYSDDIFSRLGADAKTVTLANGAVISTSDADIIPLNTVTVDENNNLVFTATTHESTGSATAKEVTITVTAPSTGSVATYVVSVYEGRVPTAITGFTTTSSLAAEKTITAESEPIAVSYADFTYADQYGKAIDEVAASGLKIKDTKSAAVEGASEAVALSSDDQGSVVLSNVNTLSLADGLGSGEAVTDTDTDALEDSAYIYAFSGGTEKVTFTLKDSSVTTNFTVIDAVKKMVAKADKTTYTAGDEATITLTAYKNATPADGTSVWKSSDINTSYKYDDYISINVAGKKYTRKATFKAGVATVTVPVLTANDEGITISIDAVDGNTVEAITTITKVSAAAFSKWVANDVDTNSTDVVLTAKDAYNNNVTTKTVSSKVVKVTAKKSATDSTSVALNGAGIDSEGSVLATVANGVITLANIVAPGDLSAGNVLTIVVDGTSYTVTVKAYDSTMDTAKTAAEAAISTFNEANKGTSTSESDVSDTTVTDTSYDDTAAEAITAYTTLGGSANDLTGYAWYTAIKTQIDNNA